MDRRGLERAQNDLAAELAGGAAAHRPEPDAPPAVSERPDRGPRVRALDALAGCRVGDALGETFFGPRDDVVGRIATRTLPSAPAGTVRWTDDTLMAASLVTALNVHDGNVDQDWLAQHLAGQLDMGRGYGHGSRDLLWEVRLGGSWRHLTKASFGGQGSLGNGAAMRVAPLGAWHAGDPGLAAHLARRQAVVTHAHPEAGDGAAAVAAAASILAHLDPAAGRVVEAPELLESARAHAGGGRVADGLAKAVDLAGATPQQAAAELGTGRDAAAYDTVPFALWSVAQSPGGFVETFWRTVAGLGDRDTTCAIACALVAAHAGAGAIPAGWDELVEPLPAWVPTG